MAKRKWGTKAHNDKQLAIEDQFNTFGWPIYSSKDMWLTRKSINGSLISISQQATRQAKELWGIIREKDRADVRRQRLLAKHFRRALPKIKRQIARDPKIIRLSSIPELLMRVQVDANALRATPPLIFSSRKKNDKSRNEAIA